MVEMKRLVDQTSLHHRRFVEPAQRCADDCGCGWELAFLFHADARQHRAHAPFAGWTSASYPGQAYVVQQGGDGDARERAGLFAELSRHPQREHGRVDGAPRVLVAGVVQGCRAQEGRRFHGAEISQLLGDASDSARKCVLASLHGLEETPHHDDGGAVVAHHPLLGGEVLVIAIATAARWPSATQPDARELVLLGGSANLAYRVTERGLEKFQLLERDVVADGQLVNAERKKQGAQLERGGIDCPARA